MNTLQKFLIANGLFSVITGIILILFSNEIAHVFEVENRIPFWAIGTGLLFFSGWVMFTAKSQNRSSVISIIVQDLLWVIGSFIVIIWKPFEISQMGNQVIGAIALIVLFFAISQSVAFVQEPTKQRQLMPGSDNSDRNVAR